MGNNIHKVVHQHPPSLLTVVLLGVAMLGIYISLVAIGIKVWDISDAIDGLLTTIPE